MCIFFCIPGDRAHGQKQPHSSAQVLEHESTFLEDLPSAQMYERSYMHRDNVTHVEVAQGSDFLITGSADGHVKFWKKQGKGVQFAKHFRAHLDAIAGMSFYRWSFRPGVAKFVVTASHPQACCVKQQTPTHCRLPCIRAPRQ